jgi:hypothetical protein
MFNTMPPINTGSKILLRALLFLVLLEMSQSSREEPHMASASKDPSKPRQAVNGGFNVKLDKREAGKHSSAHGKQKAEATHGVGQQHKQEQKPDASPKSDKRNSNEGIIADIDDLDPDPEDDDELSAQASETPDKQTQNLQQRKLSRNTRLGSYQSKHKKYASHPPIVVLVHDRADALRRLMNSVRAAAEANFSLVTVYQDGADRAVEMVVSDFKGANLVRLPESDDSRKGPVLLSRLTYNYRLMLDHAFQENSEADHVIVLEDDLIISEDALVFFRQGAHLMQRDPSVFCVSGYNDNGFASNTADASAVLRGQHFMALGWMTSRDVYERSVSKLWVMDQVWDVPFAATMAACARVCERECADEESCTSTCKDSDTCKDKCRDPHARAHECHSACHSRLACAHECVFPEIPRTKHLGDVSMHDALTTSASAQLHWFSNTRLHEGDADARTHSSTAVALAVAVASAFDQAQKDRYETSLYAHMETAEHVQCLWEMLAPRQHALVYAFQAQDQASATQASQVCVCIYMYIVNAFKFIYILMYVSDRGRKGQRRRHSHTHMHVTCIHDTTYSDMCCTFVFDNPARNKCMHRKGFQSFSIHTHTHRNFLQSSRNTHAKTTHTLSIRHASRRRLVGTPFLQLLDFWVGEAALTGFREVTITA